MPENLSSQTDNRSLMTSMTDTHQRWRLLKDKLVAYGVTIGGLSIILAIVLIFFYLLYVVFPLLLPAEAKPISHYGLPAADAGATQLLAMEEQNEIGVRFTDKAQAVFFDTHDGRVILQERLPIPEAAQISSFGHGGFEIGEIAYGLNDGRLLVAKHSYKSSYIDNKRTITPQIEYPLGKEPLVIDNQGRALTDVTIKLGDKANLILAKTADNRVILSSLSKKPSLFDDEGDWEKSEVVLDTANSPVDFLLIDKQQRNVYLLNKQGDLTVFDIINKDQPVLKHKLNISTPSVEISSVEFLNGDISMLVGNNIGEVAQWSIVRNEDNQFSVQKMRAFKIADSAIVSISPEQRRKGMLAVTADGNFGIYNTTAERELITEHLNNTRPVAAILSPRANALLLQNTDGITNFWSINNEHPEVSFKSLWQKVWYESYSKPEYIWQSSSASNDFEPKMSLVPLVFGTIKASFYAMLVAIPLSLFGAIYTGYFMAPRIRQYVKPGIEIMGALPTVILGFLAGLWLAPFVEQHLTGIFLVLFVTPLGIMLFAFIWQLLPKWVRQWVPDGWDSFVLIPVIIISGWLAFQLSPVIDASFFQGDLRTWMNNEFGIGYDQRNTLVVGLAMGFAVIPMIFSIAEDAIFSVPKHLTTGSLALGATPWQTMIKVVLLTASPGIFSAVMIGFGRAVGETMIVLMATGNTPVMDLSIFQGLRTLSANIAVEMPESEVNSTHYRVLFFAALVLFMFTFVVNTLAEIVRQNLRQKYSSL